MASLADKKCVPCEGGATPLSAAEIESLKEAVSGWDLVEVDGIQQLRRVFRFPDFAAALEFTNRVGAAAEAEGHHPLLCTAWGETTVTWWTHAINGLHENDFVMAARTDQLAVTAAQ